MRPGEIKPDRPEITADFTVSSRRIYRFERCDLAEFSLLFAMHAQSVARAPTRSVSPYDPSRAREAPNCGVRKHFMVGPNGFGDPCYPRGRV
jgi:hypothetical protein